MYGGAPYGLLPYGAFEAGTAVVGEPKATIAYDAVFNVSNDECTFEIVATSDTIGTGESVLITNSTESSPSDYSITILRDADTLELYLSSDGATWDIANGVDVGTITVSEFKFTWERIGSEIITYLNGDETARISTTDSIYDPENDYLIGCYDDDTSPWYGSVQAFRWCIGSTRYGSEHDASDTPFADSDSYTAGTVYSENYALFMGDLASSPVYGPGATLDGLSEAKAWCLETLDDDSTSQGTGGIVLAANRRFEAWMNLLGDYAACLWYPYGSDIRIQPDSAIGSERATGQDICEHGEFDASTGWTVNDWTIGSGVATVDGTQASATSLTRTLTTEYTAEYSVQLEITTISAGSLSVEVDGVEVISAQSTSGTYYGEYTADGGSADIEIIATSDAVATVNTVGVRRLAWLQTQWARNSLNIKGASARELPNSVTVKHLVPDATTPDWVYDPDPSIAVWPGADAGAYQLVSTIMEMPGLPTKAQADNRAVRKLHRMDAKNSYSFIAPDEAVLWRKGDVVDVKRTLRGVSARVWIESVEMRDYGRYLVSGSAYNPLNHTNATTYDHPFDDPPYSGSPVDGDYGDPFTDFPSYGDPGDDFVAPECQPYSCEAFLSYLADKEYTFTGIGGLGGDWDWPFASSSGDSGKLFVYSNFIAAPTLATTWSSATSQDLGKANASNWTGVTPIDGCDGAITTVANRTGGGSGSFPGTILPRAFNGPSGGVGFSADVALFAIISGWNGSGGTMRGEMFRGSGKRWTLGGSSGNNSGVCSVLVSMSTSGGEQTLSLTVGDGDGRSSDSVALGDIASQWSLAALHCVSSAPVIVGGGWRLSVTATARVGGQSISVTGYRDVSVSGTPTTATLADTTSYTQPRMFYGHTINYGLAGVGFVELEDGESFDLEAMYYAFMRNSADYDQPGFCPVY